MLRQSRKLAHLKLAQTIADGPCHTGFADVRLLHNCLPGIGMSDTALPTVVAGITLAHPIIINAVTGGADDVAETNRALAKAARATKSAMAVGSQYASLEDKRVRDTFSLVRDEYPDGVVFANLGAHVSPDQAKEAVAMIDAQALQIHLNVGQELVMREGDREFGGYLERIAAIAEVLPVPVIVKETGCGMAAEQLRQLAAAGVAAVDVGGAGGTNFLAIEAARSSRTLPEELLAWGTPTAVSLVEAKAVLPPSVSVIASGGVRSAADMAKSLALGADAVAIAGPVVRAVEHSEEAAVAWINERLQELRCLMVLCGACAPQKLSNKPLVILGETGEWLRARGLYPGARSRVRDL